MCIEKDNFLCRQSSTIAKFFATYTALRHVLIKRNYIIFTAYGIGSSYLKNLVECEYQHVSVVSVHLYWKLNINSCLAITICNAHKCFWGNQSTFFPSLSVFVFSHLPSPLSLSLSLLSDRSVDLDASLLLRQSLFSASQCLLKFNDHADDSHSAFINMYESTIKLDQCHFEKRKDTY